jgi:hypothetical protein
VSICYGGGLFIATFKNSYDAWLNGDYPRNFTRYATSTDGIVWTSRTLPGSGGRMSAATNGSVYAMVLMDTVTSTIYTSTNGINWTTRALPASGSWRPIRYVAGRFVLTRDGQTTDVVTSTDGVSWTLGDLGVSRDWGLSAGNSSTVYVPANNLALTGRSASATTASASLTVSASVSGGAAVSYQWQSSTDAGSTWANVTNATTSTLSLTGLTTANSGTRYRAAASATGATTAFSQSATLTVSG